MVRTAGTATPRVRPRRREYPKHDPTAEGVENQCTKLSYQCNAEEISYGKLLLRLRPTRSPCCGSSPACCFLPTAARKSLAGSAASPFSSVRCLGSQESSKSFAASLLLQLLSSRVLPRSSPAAKWLPLISSAIFRKVFGLWKTLASQRCCSASYFCIWRPRAQGSGVSMRHGACDGLRRRWPRAQKSLSQRTREPQKRIPFEDAKASRTMGHVCHAALASFVQKSKKQILSMTAEQSIKQRRAANSQCESQAQNNRITKVPMFQKRWSALVFSFHIFNFEIVFGFRYWDFGFVSL